ncbi:MAG: uncharacterized protein JWL93_411 [Hyphomicrobiales bacterium]|nr:uncharacterized protein [Hyphomicrobiales bacterium]
MIPWVHLDKAMIPGGGELRLMRRGQEFSIRLGQHELMNSRLSGSEEALATLTAARLEGRARTRVLIGGLGMGFTLRAALQAFDQSTEIVVAELAQAVVDWARGPMAEIFENCLADRRVSIRVEDVRGSIVAKPSAYDAILLDVDNGPEGLTQAANDRLYAWSGLGQAKAALKPGGVLAVWSSGPDEKFAKRLEKAGFSVEEVRVKAHAGRRGARHMIWLAIKPEVRR